MVAGAAVPNDFVSATGGCLTVDTSMSTTCGNIAMERPPMLFGTCGQNGSGRKIRPEVQKQLIDSVRAEVGSRSVDELAAERDEMLLELIKLRTKGESGSATCARTVRAG
jgi:hypothetical protein